MGSITASLFISLDGVIESPETWHFPYFDDEMGEVVGGLMGAAEATLLGRHTYDEFAAYWPTADPADPVTAMMNEARKYVVSSTLTEAAWQNTGLVTGDVAAGLAALREETDLGVTGSATLVQWLLEQGLCDELHLLVHPVVVGKGRRLFTDGAQVPLELLRSSTFGSGVVHSVYGPVSA